MLPVCNNIIISAKLPAKLQNGVFAKYLAPHSARFLGRCRCWTGEDLTFNSWFRCAAAAGSRISAKLELRTPHLNPEQWLLHTIYNRGTMRAIIITLGWAPGRCSAGVILPLCNQLSSAVTVTLGVTACKLPIEILSTIAIFAMWFVQSKDWQGLRKDSKGGAPHIQPTIQ